MKPEYGVRRGFTLIEVLVVVGIIGLLVSLLLPSPNLARQHARSSACKSNLSSADGHVEGMSPRQVYEDNRYWNGLGGEDITRDKHVTYKLLDGQWRFPEIP